MNIDIIHNKAVYAQPFFCYFYL